MAATTRSPRVLYHCPCHLGVLPQQDEHHHHHHSGLSSSSTAAGSSSSSSSTNPLLPTQWAASRYSYHPLPLLYFCADCLAPRCHLCAQQEIITHYCPACLFEVPSASVKAERNRCPRNCFLCPTRGCGSYLSVVATDTDPKVVAGRLEAVEASVGRPPYFLTCARCKWDSKTGFGKQQGQQQGFVFEKPTGTSAQLDAQRGPFAGQQEMDRLRNHFENFMRKQYNSNANSGAAASGSLPTSSSKSKLLRDVPGLGDSSKYLSGSRRGAASAALGLGGQGGDAAGGGTAAKEELAPYRSEHAASSRQEAAQDLALLSSLGTPSSSSSSYGAPLSHRFTSGWDSGPSSSPHPSLEPLRVPLETKKTLRCPSCRHILVKPDPKATSHRWKIKLAALNYLPEVTASFKGARGGAARGGGASASATAMEAARRRLGGTITPSPPAPGTVPLAEDVERLQPGQSYEYEISFRNPLEDVISVRIAVVQPTAAAAAAAAAATTAKEGAAEEDGKALRQRIRAHAPWIARPSTSRFTVKPFDDVDGVIDDDLLEDARGGGRGGPQEEAEDDDEEQSDGFEDVLSDEEVGGAHETAAASRRPARSAATSSSLGKGIVRKKGNETVIALRLDVRDAGSAAMANLESADVEVALRVTFTFRGDEEEEEGGEQAAKESGKGEGTDPAAGQNRRDTRSLAFWTALRLGRLDVRQGGNEMDELSARSSGGYLSVPSASALRVVQPPADSVDSAPGTSARRRSTASTAPPSSLQLLRPAVEESKGESTAEQGEGGAAAAAGGEEEDKEARLARLRKRRSEMTLTGSSRGA